MAGPALPGRHLFFGGLALPGCWFLAGLAPLGSCFLAGLALPGGLAKSASVRQTGMLKFLSILADEVLVRVRAASSFLTMHL